MADRILVLYGSYRVDRMGIRLADYIVAGLRGRGADAELIDAIITPQFFPQRSQLESQGVKVGILTRQNMHMAASSSPLSSSSSEEKAEQESIEKYSAPGASAH